MQHALHMLIRLLACIHSVIHDYDSMMFVIYIFVTQVAQQCVNQRLDVVVPSKQLYICPTSSFMTRDCRVNGALQEVLKDCPPSFHRTQPLCSDLYEAHDNDASGTITRLC